MSSTKAVVIGNESLQNWKEIGRGGFGVVHRARHKVWGFDVAIKLLHEGHSLVDMEPVLGLEAETMRKASSPDVLMVLGKYHGCPPGMGSSKRVGIVMQFMERGSLGALQRSLRGSPPWPLAFRLAHQVALGMNFLHSLKPPLLHHDLKPDNVMLDKDLNAKLTDFGLSRVSASVLWSSSRGAEQSGGTLPYTPPEAFSLSYRPVRAYDIYSYGILLWCILTGKEPYPGVSPCIVELRIPKGDRPPVEDIDPEKAEGLTELVDLMKKCWDQEPSKRPPFGKCIEVTENAFSRHELRVYGAVHQVLTKLDSERDTEDTGESGSFHSAVDVLKINIPPPAQPKRVMDSATHDAVDVATEDRSKQDLPDGLTPEPSDKRQFMFDKDKARFVDEHRATLIQDVTMVMPIVDALGDMVHREMYSRIIALKTPQAQMRVVVFDLLRSGSEVKVALYNSLKIHERCLMERLGKTP